MDVGVSVEARERRIDFHVLPEDAVERPSRLCPLEALEPPACVDASAGEGPTRGQDAVLRREPNERPLGSLPPAAGAGPDRRVRHSYAAGAVSPASAAVCSAGSTTASGASSSRIGAGMSVSTGTCCSCSSSATGAPSSGASSAPSSADSSSGSGWFGVTVPGAYSPVSASIFANSWCPGTPQKREPGSDEFGQRLPFASTAAQRPV